MFQKRRRAIAEGRGILYAVMTILAFLLLFLLSLGGLFLFHINKDFYTTFRLQSNRGFYWSAALILVFSSVLYTPFSYGISQYFILSAQGEANFRAIFFLFRNPVLLTKATIVSILKKLLVYLERLLVLFLAALVEVLLFFIGLIISGENIFSVHENPFLLAAEFMLGSPWLVGLSIGLWCGVLIGMMVIYLRYVLCKYVLLRFPDAGILQAIQIGRRSIRGHMVQTFLFYLRYGAFCVLTVISFGLTARLADAANHQSFSEYACGLVDEGWKEYCRRRSLR